ncbi:hypothetical protein ASF61_06320 [Duganella sp. Leaf126]|uniref:PEP-CTERM sorting domain-containing protein n=1 Tax=Duganella sp. Leaf126 TaxID=1736266 RepID=UPI000701E480|nr:PEP-CTERM sorting domain-containing protein [Duganella sp. Leaf126]KQQ40376.1 hypothetical protein ASF61_06320 [Duganella sp. Leaf126]
MTITLQNVLKSSAIAAAIAIAFPGASQAAPAPAGVVTYNQNAVDGGLVVDAGAKFFKEPPLGSFHAQGVALTQMTSNDSYANQFYVYCFAPAIDALQNAVYTAHQNVVVSDKVKALYETAYANTVKSVGKGTSSDAQVAFQLALWELHNDDGKLFDTTGLQYYTRGNDANVEAAQQLIDNLAGYQLKNLYTYTSYTGMDGQQVSQEMLGVSPVPEVGTWVMMGMGLGLLGVMGRRRRKHAGLGQEKFA